MTIHHHEIFYIDAATGWALADFDAEGNQIGEAEYAFRRKTLIDFAAGNLDKMTRVYSKSGLHQRTLNA